jgi:hypothetical protein
MFWIKLSVVIITVCAAGWLYYAVINFRPEDYYDEDKNGDCDDDYLGRW